MIFQIFNPNGLAVESTAYWSCVPSKAMLESMNAAGYIFKINGSRIKLRELIELKDSMLKEGYL